MQSINLAKLRRFMPAFVWYVDIENGDEYWISGLKKAESNRHWAGRGKILIDRRAVPEYLALIGEPNMKHS
ncbi:hypothetical protein [Intestinimonas timonensis]|uniref:hypothetical protein n=1 Tax=Intestinimonas timonensis TaxID=1689270 RepID=UPI001F5E5963|nr:hypothetical protein [Intestinimonas timonensis]